MTLLSTSTSRVSFSRKVTCVVNVTRCQENDKVEKVRYQNYNYWTWDFSTPVLDLVLEIVANVFSKLMICCFSQSLKILNRRPPSYNNNKLSFQSSQSSDSCSLYKISLNQELFYQYIEYDKDLPDLKELTLCMWTKFHNHSQDHPLFSYSGKFCLNIYNFLITSAINTLAVIPALHAD